MRFWGETSTDASRQAASLYGVCGVLGLIAMVPAGADRQMLVLVSVVELMIAAVIAALPWAKWQPSASLAIVFPSLALIGVSSDAGLIPPRAYGLFFVLVFAWVGLHHPKGTAFRVLPAAMIAYALPLMMTHATPPLDLRAFGLAMATCLMVAETIARARHLVALSVQRSERAAQGFRTVARTSALLRQLDRSEVLDAVSDGVMELGYDGVHLVIIDPESDTFEVAHARGIAARFPDRRYRVADGLAGLVRDRGDVVVVDDYQTARQSIDVIRAQGVRLAIGVPVLQSGELAGVLVATGLQVRAVGPDDVEVLRVLADVAGAALTSVQESHAHEQAAHTDELTGLPNRREATNMLNRVRPGDAIALLDLDHFGRVNETHGHAGGDDVLRNFGAHLQTTLRDGDRVARYGGEEFVVVLPKCDRAAATKVIARLMESWRATMPVTTFSAGIAFHQEGRTVEQTLADADEALYDAKRGGRDTIGGVIDMRISSSSAS